MKRFVCSAGSSTGRKPTRQAVHAKFFGRPAHFGKGGWAFSGLFTCLQAAASERLLRSAGAGPPGDRASLAELAPAAQALSDAVGLGRTRRQLSLDVDVRERRRVVRCEPQRVAAACARGSARTAHRGGRSEQGRRRRAAGAFRGSPRLSDRRLIEHAVGHHCDRREIDAGCTGSRAARPASGSRAIAPTRASACSSVSPTLVDEDRFDDHLDPAEQDLQCAGLVSATW